MPHKSQIEDRLSSLERDVAELRHRLNGKDTAANWLANMEGSMKDHPAFEEVLKLGRQAREADVPGGEDKP